MTRWSQFASLGLALLAGRSSLRDVVGNQRAQVGKPDHLGCGEVYRSSLARVNKELSDLLYEALFGKLVNRCQALGIWHRVRFKNLLYSLDGSTIVLCLSVFTWAKFRTTEGRPVWQ